ncbi:MAG: glutathione S-transferase family protein [Sphingomonadaceae bacterium]|uniref:glutathione S-transferase family protein n=1 Tax=Thermaurantiacus sp. TaxID=2820283 RepID=UPI00298F372F|nr:glutathione S-transferase family protein [Thermaurantiacus sp.]MCS6986115.1 glutathione S-transferase family protein [Sphingomonadaceae bacterium]MDW8414669.1 glutathione S-transferase family protein [Thermaurantiacus sp.]
MVRLYDMRMAPNPRRVRIFLAEKGIEVPREEVDIPSGANLSPEFLAINPRGVLPTLVLDDGTVLDESIAICRYFEELQPEPNLMGRDPLDKARIESWQRRMEFDGLLNIAAIFRNTAPAFAHRSAPGAVPATDHIPALAERGRVLARHWLDALERRLAEQPFVAGDRFTVADITAFVCVEFGKWVDLRPGDGHPAVRRWYQAIRARPSAQA